MTDNTNTKPYLPAKTHWDQTNGLTRVWINGTHKLITFKTEDYNSFVDTVQEIADVSTEIYFETGNDEGCGDDMDADQAEFEVAGKTIEAHHMLNKLVKNLYVESRKALHAIREEKYRLTRKEERKLMSRAKLFVYTFYNYFISYNKKIEVPNTNPVEYRWHNCLDFTDAHTRIWAAQKTDFIIGQIFKEFVVNSNHREKAKAKKQILPSIKKHKD